MNIKEVFASVDAKDTAKYVSYFTEDASMKFANNPAAVGKQSISQLVDGIFTTVKGLRHTIVGVWEHPDSIICNGEVTYIRFDDSQVTIPFAGIYKLQGDLVQEYQVYIDSTPLFQQDEQITV